MIPDPLPDNLNPENNPMIFTPDLEPEPEKVSSFDGAPMREISPDPATIAEKLSEKFPCQDMVRIDVNLTLVKSAAGTFATDRGYAIADLPVEDLAKIAAFLADRGR